MPRGDTVAPGSLLLLVVLGVPSDQRGQGNAGVPAGNGFEPLSCHLREDGRIEGLCIFDGRWLVRPHAVIPAGARIAVSVVHRTVAHVLVQVGWQVARSGFA